MDSVLTASRASLAHAPSEGSLKHLNLEGTMSQSSLQSADSASRKVSCYGEGSSREPNSPALSEPSASSIVSPEQQNPIQDEQGQAAKDSRKDGPRTSSAPLKATNFGHVRQKYLAELEYMLTEFKKLELQLLGAKAATRESAGSRERREKLHSFILHLEDTIQQIHTGCQLEAEGKSTIQQPVDDSALIKPNQEKKEEENVQKLEEHILANLLPVKVRLKKQLAAQQGAKHNPAGMPVRGSMVSMHQEKGKATFAAPGEQKRRMSSASHFGKPLDGGGSSLTQKLHGPTLGSSSRTHGHGVGSSENDKKDAASGNKILFAGMAIGSDQIESSVDAASAAHTMVINDPAFLELARKPADAAEAQPTLSEVSTALITAESSHIENHRLRVKKKKRKRKRKAMDDDTRKENDVAKKIPQSKRKKGAASGKKRGPRAVEYMCALCNEVYSSTCEYNPWWALTQQECPKCHKTQVSFDMGKVYWSLTGPPSECRTYSPHAYILVICNTDTSSRHQRSC